MSDSEHGTLIVCPTRDGLRARCGCGADLGPSMTWELSQAALKAHMGTSRSEEEGTR